MTQSHRLARDPALAAVAFAFACVLAGWPSAGEAGKTKSNPPQAPQSAPAPASEAAQEADQKKQAAAAARQAYDAGLKAFANGKYQPAVDQLSAAVKGGGLSSAEIAKALYTRGAAYKKQNKPGLAISDLTSALWLKNGLTGTDRQKATAERAEAYNMAGLQETGDASERAVVDNPNSSASSSSAGLSAAAVAQAAASQSQPASANASGASGAAPAASGPVTRQDAESDAAKDAARARAAYGTVDGGWIASGCHSDRCSLSRRIGGAGRVRRLEHVCNGSACRGFARGSSRSASSIKFNVFSIRLLFEPFRRRIASAGSRGSGIGCRHHGFDGPRRA